MEKFLNTAERHKGKTLRPQINQNEHSPCTTPMSSDSPSSVD